MRHLVVTCLFLGCGLSTSEPSQLQTHSSSEQSIVGGTVVVNRDNAVVVLLELVQGSYYEYCTGTLVGPKTVVTAAHCVQGFGNYFAATGDSVDIRRQTVRIVSQTKHPNYSRDYDFGVLQLAAPILNVSPIPINEKPFGPASVGLSIRHVGFGNTSAANGGTGNGTKREVTYSVRQVLPLRIESGANGKQTCQGDSGGPALSVMPGDSTESLVGVVSYGDQDCLYEGWDGRVDAVAPWIRTVMAQWETPTCSTDGACLPGCMPIDQDCACKQDGQCTAECLDISTDLDCPKDCLSNGICAVQSCPRPDVDCVADGSLCAGVQSCQSRICRADAQHPEKYCSRTCTDNSTCGNGLMCINSQCSYPQKPERKLFDVCAAGSEFCVDSFCSGPKGAAFQRCVLHCIVTSDCPNGSTCAVAPDSARFCQPSNLKFSNVVLPRFSEFSAPVAEGCQSVGASILTLLPLVLLRLRRRYQ
jgi:hypothetical protein